MNRTLLRFALAASLVAGSLVMLVAALPGAAWAASPELDQAQGLYDQAKFPEAVAQLREALASGQIAGPDALKAKELLGRCLVKAGNRLEAKEAFKSLLRTDAGYRLDPVSVPPDEREVFDLALKEINAEQIEAGRRIPASLAGYVGWEFGGHEDVNDYLSGNKAQDAKIQTEFGGSVRFPVKPRWSLDIAITHHASEGDYTISSFTYDLKTSAVSIVGNVVYSLMQGSKLRGYLGVGAGPLAQAQLQIVPRTFSAIQLSNARTGMVAQAFLEGEYMVHPKLGLSASVAGRKANSGKLNFGPGYDATNTNFNLNGRPVDYSGFAARLALRGYIGY